MPNYAFVLWRMSVKRYHIRNHCKRGQTTYSAFRVKVGVECQTHFSLKWSFECTILNIIAVLSGINQVKLMVQNVSDLVPESKTCSRGAGPVHFWVCCIIYLLENTSSWWCHVLLTFKIQDNKVKTITPALIVIKCIYFLFIYVFCRKVLWLSLEEQV